jgi:hypothetical protein
VTLAQGTGHSTISAASGPSNSSGVVTFTVTDTTAEVVAYTATDATDSATITQTATVTFTNGNTISFNTPITVAVQPNSTTTYTFAGATGQVVNTELANWSGTITLSILDPTGAVVSSNGNTGNTVDLHAVALQSTGTFTIQIVSGSGTSGNATLSLTSNTTGPTINFNTPVSVVLSSSADAEFAYTFSGTAGQVVNSEITN